MLALKDYHDRLEVGYISKRNLVMEKIDMSFTIVFTIECLLKILGMGFFWHKQAYLRNMWNWLDFFVVGISVVDFLP